MDGKKVFPWRREDKTIAVRAGKIYIGNGKVLKNGTVLVKGGKIVSIGEDLALSGTEEILDFPGCTVTPGLFDFCSSLGLHGNGGPPKLGITLDPSGAVDTTEPGFKEAMESGVTALVVSGRGFMGRGSLFKTSRGGGNALVKDTSLVFVSFSNVKALYATLDSAVAYRKKWDSWRKSYGEWKRKRFGPASRPSMPFKKVETRKKPGKPKPKGKKVEKTGPRKKEAKGQTDPVTGVWKGTVSGLPNGKVAKCILRLRLQEGRVTGMIQGPFRFRRNAPPIIPLLGSFENGELRLQAKTRSGKVVFRMKARIAGNTLEGNWSLLGGKLKGTIKAKREKPGKGSVWEEKGEGALVLDLSGLDDDLEGDELFLGEDQEGFLDPLPPLPPVDPSIFAEADPISGTWKGRLSGFPRVRTLPFTMVLTLKGTEVTGKAHLPIRRRGGPPEEPLRGTYSGGTLSLSGVILPIRLKATVSMNHMEGNWSLGPFKGTFTADRTGKAKVSAGSGRQEKGRRKKRKSPPGGPPEEPGKDERYEPWLRVLEGKAGVVLNTNSPSALKEALGALRKKYGISRIVVVDSRASRACLEEIRKAGAGVLVIPGRAPSPGREGPSIYSRKNIPLVLGSCSREGVRWLALHAAYLVKIGVDPGEALKAVTFWPAFFAKAEKRLGSLLPGRDADMVVWTGDPFDLSSRVKEVILEGKVVYEDEKGD